MKRIGLAIVVLLFTVTTASFAYNALTGDREVPASNLYPGPYIELNGAKVAYRQWGSSGSPIVLVHGFAESTFVWSAVGPLLGSDHRVYALDLTGFGYSQRVGPYTLAAWSKEVETFIEALHLQRPILVGHSLGAAVVANVALQDPGAVSGIVLADGDALSNGGPPAWTRSLLVDPYFTSLFRIVTGSGWIIGRILDSAYGPNHPTITPSLIQDWVQPFRVQGSADALEAMAHSPDAIPGLTTTQLAEVGVPATFIWGADDGVDPLAAGREAAALLRAPVNVLPGAGHLSMLSEPGAFAKVVDTFVALNLGSRP